MQQLGDLRQRLRPTQCRGFFCVTADIAACDPLDWLASQTQWPRIFWQARPQDGQRAPAYAALGAARQLHTLPDLTHTDEAGARYFGGLAFDSAQQPWPEFGASRFVLPRLMLVASDAGCQLQLNLWFASADPAAEWAAAETALAALVTAAALAPLTPARWQRRDCPNRTAWQALVEQVT
ncbi:MAG: isochorismate synthase, partial [Aeromonas sp.]